MTWLIRQNGRSVWPAPWADRSRHKDGDDRQAAGGTTSGGTKSLSFRASAEGGGEGEGAPSGGGSGGGGDTGEGHSTHGSGGGPVGPSDRGPGGEGPGSPESTATRADINDPRTVGFEKGPGARDILSGIGKGMTQGSVLGLPGMAIGAIAGAGYGYATGTRGGSVVDRGGAAAPSGPGPSSAGPNAPSGGGGGPVAGGGPTPQGAEGGASPQTVSIPSASRSVQSLAEALSRLDPSTVAVAAGADPVTATADAKELMMRVKLFQHNLARASQANRRG